VNSCQKRDQLIVGGTSDYQYNPASVRTLSVILSMKFDRVTAFFRRVEVCISNIAMPSEKFKKSHHNFSVIGFGFWFFWFFPTLFLFLDYPRSPRSTLSMIAS
tara:strand:- start:888 stop:1196 length:309 start_codon:yes stop_codon:yes gene_type:complete